jgi:xanthine dehydrogenase accessory factor
MRPYVAVTVVRAQRPTSVRAGDSARVLGNGTIEGFVGGACAEESVRLHALRVLETGEPLLLRIVPGDAAGEAEEGAVVEANPCLSGGAVEVFLEPHLPAPKLNVAGETPVARALGELGRRLGFELAGGAPAGDEAAVVVASHGRDEEQVLERALLDGVAYVGLVASRARGAAVVAGLDVPDELRQRVHTPAGLDIGARTPEEIALSILAEIVAERRASPVGDPAATTLRVADEHHACH